MTQAAMQDTTGNQDGAAIRRLRENLDLKVPDLAKAVGLHPQSLRNIELNRKPAGLQTLVKLAAQFNVTVDQLLRAA